MRLESAGGLNSCGPVETLKVSRKITVVVNRDKHANTAKHLEILVENCVHNMCEPTQNELR